MGFDLGKIFKKAANAVESGTKSIVNAGFTKPLSVAGEGAGAFLAPVAQSGALQQITTGATAAFTGGGSTAVSGGLAALGGQGPGTFSGISDLIRRISGTGESAPGGSSIAPVTSLPPSAPASSSRPAWLMPVLIGGGALLAVVVAFFAFRRK